MFVKLHRKFESFVNSEEYQTRIKESYDRIRFESFVNSEEYQTINIWTI